uniref:Uncharacterized protein n=1 Tax=Sphaerodactylus townsendi TaxID=933632 RepID=A0ACB8F876_9SAUR
MLGLGEPGWAQSPTPSLPRHGVSLPADWLIDRLKDQRASGSASHPVLEAVSRRGREVASCRDGEYQIDEASQCSAVSSLGAGVAVASRGSATSLGATLGLVPGHSDTELPQLSEM